MLCMGKYLTAVLCVTVALCRATTSATDQLMPGIRTRDVPSPHLERRRPTHGQVGSSIPINFWPFKAVGGHEASDADVSNSPDLETGPTAGLFIRRANDNDQDRTLAGSYGDRRPPLDVTNSGQLEGSEKMSMSTMKAMSKARTMEEFARIMGITMPQETEVAGVVEIDGSPQITARFGGPDNVIDNPISASCDPELQPVKLKIEPQPNVVYFPTCVRLLQCGGCCPSHLLECKPTAKKPIKIKVLRVGGDEPSGRSAVNEIDEGPSRRRRTRPGNSRGRRRTAPSYEVVDAEEHTHCECQCRKQEQDCNPSVHDYLEQDCQCACRNIDERSKCEAKGPTHFWDEEDCKCYCHSSSSCSSEHFYDNETCSCSRVPVQGRSSAGDGPGADGPTRPSTGRVPVVFEQFG